MTATHRGPEQPGHFRRWLVASAAVATLIATGLIASLALGSTPQRDAATGYAATATTAATAVAASDTPTGTPATTTALPTPHPSATTTHAASAKPSTAAIEASQGTTSVSAPQVGRIEPGVSYNGVATEYAAGDGDGACLFGPSTTMMIAAMNYTDYENSKACGDHVLVRAADGASITVLITNECPLPCAPGQLDLSQQAFAKIANPSAGRISVTWQLLSPSTSDTISLRYKSGSSQWWCAIQVIGERNPIAQLEVRTGSGWMQVPRTSYNYFLSANGTGCGGAIRITDIYGQQLTVTGISIQPNVIQPTQVQFAQH